MDFELSKEERMTQEMVRAFAEKEIKPRVREMEEMASIPAELWRSLGEVGLLGITIPQEYGGAGMTSLQYILALEEMARIDGAVTLSVSAHNSLCSTHIFLAGNDEQKQQYLVPLARGEKIGAWAMTEPNSGSDAAGLQSTAVKKGKHWILNGTKTFVTNARTAQTAVIHAATDKKEGKQGISAFIVDLEGTGVRLGKSEKKLGMRASDTSQLILEECPVREENLLGERNHGFSDALRVLDGGRIGIAAMALGIAEGAFDASLAYSKEREQFGQPIATFQAIQWKLSEMKTKIEAARGLVHRAAYRKDRGKDFTLHASMAKYFASEMSVAVCNEAVQIHGGYGYITEYPVEKYFRDAKLTTIGEGTSEIQQHIIAREILLNRSPSGG